MWNPRNNPSSQESSSKKPEEDSSNNTENLMNMAKAFSGLMNDNTQPPSSDSVDELDLDELFSEFTNHSKEEHSSDKSSKSAKDPSTSTESTSPQNTSTMDIEKMMNMAKMFSSFMGDPPKKKTPVNNRPLFGPPRRTGTKQRRAPAPSIQWAPSQFDEYIQTSDLNMIKAVIPYFDVPQQRLFGILLKSLELKKVMDLYPTTELTKLSNPFKVESNWKLGMLKAVRPHCSEEKQTFIDMIAKMMDMSDLMGTMQNFLPQSTTSQGTPSSSGPQMESLINALGSSLDPKQKQMLDLFSSILKQNNS